MKTRNAFESRSRHSLWLRVLAVLMCVLLGFSLVNIALSRVEADVVDDDVYGTGALWSGTIDLDNPKVDLSEAMHIIIRHWHAEANPDANDNTGENTVIIGAYIVPDNNGNIVVSNNEKYTCYARAYTSYQEPDKKDHKDNYVKVLKDSECTDRDEFSVYIAIKDNKVVFKANPFDNGNKDNPVYYERFAGFSVSAGQPAVTIYNGKEENEYADATLTIDPAKIEKNHLVKSHLFYISEMSLVKGEELMSNKKNFPDYQDTEAIGSDKYYNTSKGLHTDKTATMNTAYTDGRTYDLDLETWYNEDDPVNVGMVLDASGSMGFTANTPKPIRVMDASGTLRSNYSVPTNVQTTLKNKKNSSTLLGAFLDNDELAYFMNPRKTDNSSIRSSSYTYFLYDARTGTEEFTPLAYWDGGRIFSEKLISDSNREKGNTDLAKYGTDYVYAYYENTEVVIGQITNPGGEGWYYNNPTGSWTTNYFKENVQSGKNLIGIPSGYTFYDEITLSNTTNFPFVKKPDLSKVDKTLDENYAKGNNRSRTYTSNGTTPCKFYIDSQGYLRCLYWIADTYKNDGDMRRGASYVYENNDQDYIKVEALQRALGAFMTGLNTDSPESLMSAVRFSTPYAKNNRDALVLMDWTNNILDAQQVLSNQRGKKVFNDGTVFYGTRKGTSSDGSDFANLMGGGIEQYNYGLTGSTSTIQGLASFESYLQGRLSSYYNKTDNNGKKYIIVFTDGKDTDLREDPNQTEALTAANRLKAAGYTIFCVMLAGGPIQPKDKESDPDGDYELAYNFLKSLSGSGLDANGKPVTKVKDNKYVYSTAEYRHKDSGTGSNSVDDLVDIFTSTNGILDKMSEDLKNYTVQDYIDPRFDLIDADGTIWNLNAGGEVKVGSTTYDLSDGKSVTFTLYNSKYDSNLGNVLTVSEKDVDGNIVAGAETAELYYDAVKDMYYLKWTSQTIPTTYEGASRAKVWHSKVTVRAKDDFIGGNTVLTNGNNKGENYVYHEDDSDANSGITDTTKDTNDQYPSKGFPRTTVNVQTGEASAKGDIEIYEGDDLDFKSIIKKLIENALDKEDYTTASLWEYLERYVDYYNEHPEYQDELKPHFEGIDDDEALSKLLDSDGKLSYEKLVEAIFDSKSVFGKDSKIEIPYGYLPNTSNSNQTGLEKHEMDLVGFLTYGASQTDENGDYDKKDTDPRKFETDITFDPFVESDRMDDIEELVSDKDYHWDSGYKETQGDPAIPESIEGESNVTIVSGEITLQAYLSEEDIEALVKAGVTKISYTADLIKDGEDKVGTFTVEITIDPETGEITQNITTIEYTEEYDFVRGSDGEKDNGLQFGKYTLTNGKTSYEYSDGSVKSSGPIKFGTPTVVQDDDAYVDDSFELDIKGSDDPFGHRAKLGDGEIELGELKEDGTPNLNSRFGIFGVRGTPTYGDLSISKTVKGANDTDTIFTFMVELTPPYTTMFTDKMLESFKGKYTYADGTTSTETIAITEHEKDGVKYYTATVELKHGDTVVIKDIPADVKYKVTETSHDGYVVESKGDNGIIVDEETQYASFINSPIVLSVTKQVMIDPLRKLNNMPNLDDISFNFELTLHDAEYMNKSVDAIVLKYDESDDSWIYQVKSVAVTPAENGLLISGDDGNGNPVYATTDIDEITYYIYVNSTTPTVSLMDTSNDNSIDPAIQVFGVHANLIPKATVDNDSDWQYNGGGITVEQPVYRSDVSGAGNALDVQVELVYETQSLDFVNNTAVFELKDGEGLLINGLPTGTEYTVREIIEEDSDFFFNHVNLGNSRYDNVEEDFDDLTEKFTYTVFGTISSNKSSDVHYFNSTIDFRLPLTGGNSMIVIYMMISSMLLILSGAIVLICLKKRRTQY